MSREKLMEFLKKLHYNYRGMAGIVSTDGNGNKIATVPQSVPYQPLELE
jgi:hypothetical protein